MYIETILGYDPNKKIEQSEMHDYFVKREALVKEFMLEHLDENKRKIFHTFEYEKEEGEGFYYGFVDEKKGNMYFKYYFSDFEFGSGIRKNDDDKRFKMMSWKLFMIRKLVKISPEIAKKYLEQWNNEYSMFRYKTSGFSDEVIKEVKDNCMLGESIISEEIDRLLEEKEEDKTV